VVSARAQRVGKRFAKRTEEETMATSQASTLATEQPDRRKAVRRHRPSLLVRLGDILKRCYERACSAILDPEGDCMRL
jgi:hypothetical protein